MRVPSFHHQLPAYSPLSAAALFAAIARIGRPTERFAAQSLIESEFDADAAVLVDSGRSALQLALSVALAARPSSRMAALPAFQCFELASAAVGADATLVFYDVDPETLGPDLDSFTRALRSGAQAVVVAPLFGLPVDWDALHRMASAHGAVLIEDAAQCDGAEWRGRRLGTLGDLSVLSFGRGKGWTGGGGGALCARGPFANALSAQPLLPDAGVPATLRAAMLTIAQWKLGRPWIYGIPASIPGLELGETHYHPPTDPQTISSFSAALLRRTSEAMRAERGTRRRNAEWFNRELEFSGGAARVASQGAPGYLRFPVRVGGQAAVALTSRRGRRLGIARSYPTILPDLPAVAGRVAAPAARFTGAQALTEGLVTLPTHSRVTEEDREQMRQLFRDVLPRGSGAIG